MTEALRFIHTSVDRLDQMVAMLLQLAEAGRRVMNLQTVDMNELVAGVVRSYQPQLADKNIEIMVGALPTIQTDRQASVQIVGSLLDNAIKYLQPGRRGKIGIACAGGGGEYRFEVRDNGRGVTAGDLEKIFDIFRRAGQAGHPGRRHGPGLRPDPRPAARRQSVVRVGSGGRHENDGCAAQIISARKGLCPLAVKHS